MVKRGHLAAAAAVALLLGTAPILSAAIVYTDDFNINTSANYNVYVTPGSTGPSGDAPFAYNYGNAPGAGGLSLPVAPHTLDASTLRSEEHTSELQSLAYLV